MFENVLIPVCDPCDWRAGAATVHCRQLDMLDTVSPTATRGCLAWPSHRSECALPPTIIPLPIALSML